MLMQMLLCANNTRQPNMRVLEHQSMNAVTYLRFVRRFVIETGGVLYYMLRRMLLCANKTRQHNMSAPEHQSTSHRSA